MNTIDLVIEHLKETLPPETTISACYSNTILIKNHKANNIYLHTENVPTITIWRVNQPDVNIDLNSPNSLEQLTKHLTDIITKYYTT